MINQREFEYFSLGISLGAILVLSVAAIISLGWPKATQLYREGVNDTHKEAFENGLMIKEVTKDDTVIYRWLELHKQPEE